MQQIRHILCQAIFVILDILSKITCMVKLTLVGHLGVAYHVPVMNIISVSTFMVRISLTDLELFNPDSTMITSRRSVIEKGTCFYLR